jgi:hypothetical protein
MRLLPILALLTLPILACRSASPREEGSPTPKPSVAPEAPAEPKPAEPVLTAEEKEKKRSEAAAAAIARIPQIKEGLAKLRQLDFRTEVPGEMQSTADFRTFLKTSIDEELPPQKAEAIAVAYTQVGLLEKQLDLRKTLEDAMVSQAGAYYDPKAKKFFMVMVPASDLIFDTITAHELTHALQDQHFDLRAYYDLKDKQVIALGDDALNARRFIVEGEATLTMLAYVIHSMTKRDALGPELMPMLEKQLEGFAKMGIEELKASTKQQASGFLDMGDEVRNAIEAMDDVPLVLMLPLLESYGRGALPVLAAYKRGGWAEVAKLYARPPESTEQVLHPDTKLFPTRDLPRVVTLPKAPAGYQPVYSDTFGELGWRVYFLLWNKASNQAKNDASSDAAAAGWDGDRYAVFRGKGGDLLTFQVTTWDSEAEAQEFEAAYRLSLAKRFGGDGQERGDGAPILVERRGAEVFIVDGKNADQLMPALVKGTKLKALE